MKFKNKHDSSASFFGANLRRRSGQYEISAFTGGYYLNPERHNHPSNASFRVLTMNLKKMDVEKFICQTK